MKPFVLFSISVTVTLIGAELSYYRVALWDTQQSSVGGAGELSHSHKSHDKKEKRKLKKKIRKSCSIEHRMLDQYNQQSIFELDI